MKLHFKTEDQIIKDLNLQGCEYCERFADLDLMHSTDDIYVCEICWSKSITISTN